ncbi:Aste57867_21115 [Aphanomyces stellatus]|uniref:Aste57867_21115 protein n=1 Tax=Aphanomyces stellatus TaxID=120398 RepID=A0A485LGP4_9STRA|nr:hypothetical protein As57867_021047 [Aphanomyces stellatus]VFT97789.1 Aste57867_21115 [Aphanomyces stellatus]
MDSSWKKVSVLDNLKDHLVASSPFGGPIAMMRDLSRLAKDDMGTHSLFIFNACGVKLASIDISSYMKKTLRGMFWTDKMHLFCVFDDGNCMSYNVKGAPVRSFTLFPADSKLKVMSLESWGSGFVALLDNFTIAQALDIDTAHPRVHSILETVVSPSNPPTCMAVLDPRFVKSGHPEIFLGTSTNSVVVIQATASSSEPARALDMQFDASLSAPIRKITISPDGQLLALFTQDGTLIVVNTAFDDKILVFDTQSIFPPGAMCWCGDSSVLLFWSSLGLVLVGFRGSWLKFPCDEGPIILCQEIDGCRIFSSQSHQMLLRVSPAMENKMDRTAPAAMLIAASSAFHAEEYAKADAIMSNLCQQNWLSQAIHDCIHAAGDEFDHAEQGALLRVASYGKNHGVDDLTQQQQSTLFTDMCRHLRVLNALRDPSVGLALTMTQFNRLECDGVLRRLATMHHEDLAHKICEFMHIEPSCTSSNFGHERNAA